MFSIQATQDCPESKCQQLIDSLPEMIFEIDQQMNIVLCNTKAYQVIGYTIEDLEKGLKITQLIAPEDLERAKNNMKKVLGGASNQDNKYIFIKKDGTRFPVAVNAVPIIQDGVLVGGRGIITDLTSTQKIEKELNLLTLAIQESFDGIVVGDPDGTISYTNQTIREMLQIQNPNQLIGKHVLQYIIPADRERATQKSRQSIQTGQGWTEQFTLQTTQGQTLPIEVTCAPIKDQNNHTVGFIDIIRDITNRVKNEAKLKEATKKIELINEKLLVVGGLVRHDIANKLTTIDANLYLAKKTGKTDNLIAAVEEASAQIKRILAFSKDYEMLGTEQLSYINAGQTFDQTIILFSELKNIQIINKATNLNVLADSLLKELFYNLIENTKKYGQKTTQIKLTYTQQNQELKLIYEDDGVGIPNDQKPKLFTKGYGKGTGLGLYLIKKTLDVYGWQIQETGTEGQGAKFQITIPNYNPTQEKPNYQLTQPQ
jgi:PAS domain S-box-containing protein